MLRRKDVQAELQVSTNQIAEVEKHHYYQVPTILTEIQHKRLSQLTLQSLDPRTVFLSALPKLMSLNTDRYDDWDFSDKFLDRGSDNWPHYYSHQNSHNADRLLKIRNLESRLRAKLNDKEEQQYFECLGKPFGNTWYAGKAD